jgi:ribosomal protein S27E
LSVLHQAVREGWPQVSASVSLPQRVHEEVRRYLQCGELRQGFVVVKCEECAEATLVAFSCKGRGWCPSCGARRAHEAALHLNEVLPQVAYRQWTLSLPGALRWLVVKEPKLLRAVERCLVRSIFRWQRLRARQLGASGKKACGAVCFVQLFGSALQLTPHLHLLVPEGVWSEGVFVELPPPTTEDVEAVLARAVRQLLPLFESKEAPWPEDDFEALQARGTQLRLLPTEEREPGRKGLLAVAMGLSLHAGTWVHGNDRAGLLRLCRYGARGPIAESRLSRREDGRYAYGTKRGVTLVMTAAQLVRRLLWLIPPKGLHLTNFHGLLAPHAAERARVMPKPRLQQLALPLPVPVKKPRRPRIDWATLLHRTFGCEVWKCGCGGQRRVVALVANRRTAEQMLRNMGLLHPWPPLPAAQGPPQLELLP